MSINDKRLEKIREYKKIYEDKLECAESELEHDLITIRLNQYCEMEKELLG